MNEWLGRVLTDIYNKKQVNKEKAQNLLDKIIAILFKTQYIKDSNNLLTEGTKENERQATD